MIYKTIDISQPLTPEQIKMLHEAASMDIPEEFTDEELKEFKRVSQGRHAARQKQNVTLLLNEIDCKLQEAEKEAELTDKRYSSKEVVDAMKAAIRGEQNDNTSATAIRKAQSAFEGAAEALSLSDEDDIQALIDEVLYEDS